MANQCMNQLVLSGDRASIFKLIMSDELHYKKNEIHEINDNCFCLIFMSDWDPPENYFQKISKKFPKIQIDLFYMEKLLKKIGRISFEAGEKIKREKKLDINFTDMNKPITFDIFNGL
jgi:hypothetical protein